MNRALLPAFAAAAVLAVAPAAAVAPVRAQSTAPSSPAATEKFDDAELKAFAKAATHVRRIRHDFGPRYQKAASPEAKQQIQKEATRKSVKAIEDEGLTVETFNRIARVAENDPATAEKINRHLR